MYVDDGIKELAASIVEAILYDIKRTKDPFLYDSLLRWFDTSYGITICDIADMDPEKIKKYIREVKTLEKRTKADRRNDYQRVKEVYQERGKKS